MKIKYYIAIARPEHWIKNAFILPGIVLAEFFVSKPLGSLLYPFILTLISACLVASANYTINEWLDAPYDKHHPVKKNRPAVVGNLNRNIVWAQYILLGAVGIAVGYLASFWVFVAAIALFVQGFFYNVEPFRTKDRIVLDVVSESINNPIRLLMGWGIVTNEIFPPWSVLVGYWFFGAFLMDIKRYAEYRFIGDKELASKYRRSFAKYSEEVLLLWAIFYSLCSGVFFAVFMIKHRIELLLVLPLVAALYTWYFHIGMKKDSPAVNPERIPRTEKGFTLFLIFFCIVSVLLFAVDIPALSWFLGPAENFDINIIFSN